MRQLIILLILFISVAALFAQTRPDSLNTPRYKLSGLRVVADGPGESIGSVEQKSFSKDRAVTDMQIGDTLEDISGVSLTMGAKGLSNLRIRGFDKSQVKVLVDGRPIGGGYFGSVDVNMLPVSELEAVQVHKGPASSLYGANAMGGVVNILTRKPDNSSWLRMGAQFRRNLTNRVWVSSSRVLGYMDYWAYISHSAQDGMMLSEDFVPTGNENGGVRNNDDREQWDAQLRLGYKLVGDHRIEVHGGYTTMPEKGIPPDIYDFVPLHRRYTDWLRYQLSVSGAFHTSAASNVDASVYWDAYDDTYETYKDATYTEVQLHSVLKNSRLGVRLNGDWDAAPGVRLEGGYCGEYSDYDRKDNGSYTVWTSHWRQHHNLFGQVMFKRGPWGLTVGMGGYVFTQDDRDNWIGHVEPSAGLRWRDRKGRAVGLAYSRTGKFPALHNLFSESKGNPDLRPEYANKYELTVETPFTSGEWSGDFIQTAFYNDINDQIETLGGTYENVEKIRSWGGETTVRTRWRWWRQHASFSLLRYTDDSDIPLLEAAEHSASIHETFTLPWQVELSLRSRWFDGRVSSSDSGFHDLPSYWLHDMYAHYSFRRWKLSAGVENLLDENYQEEYGYPGPGIDYILSVEVEL